MVSTAETLLKEVVWEDGVIVGTQLSTEIILNAVCFILEGIVNFSLQRRGYRGTVQLYLIRVSLFQVLIVVRGCWLVVVMIDMDVQDRLHDLS